MKKLDGFIIKSYIGPMLLTFIIALFILLMQFLWKYVDDMVGKGFEWFIIGELLFYASATFVPLALPLAILLASLMTFGNLGENYELVAIKASGISFRRAMLPLVTFTLILSFIALLFSNYVLPVANLKFGTLLYDIQEKKPALNINEGVFYSEITGYVIRVGNKDKDGKTINDILIYDHLADVGNTNVTIAKQGKMEMTPDKKFLIFTLWNGENYNEEGEKSNNKSSRPLKRTKFDEEIMRIDLSSFSMQRSKEELFKDNYQMLSIGQLREAEDTLIRVSNERDKQFYIQLMNNFKFYKKFDSLNSKYLKLDSKKTLLKGDFINNLPKADRGKYIDIAMSVVRGINDNFEFNKMTNDGFKQTIARHAIERHRKFTLSFACLLLFFIGAPLGAIIRKGGLGLPVVFATLFFIIFHVFNMTGEKLVREGEMPAYKGMWLSTFVFLPVGILLTYAATTDSPILSSEMWKRFFKKLFIYRKKEL